MAITLADLAAIERALEVPFPQNYGTLACKHAPELVKALRAALRIVKATQEYREHLRSVGDDKLGDEDRALIDALLDYEEKAHDIP